MLTVNMALPLHAKEYGIAVLPLIFTLGTLHSSTSDEGSALLLMKAQLCNFPGTGQCIVDTIWPFLGRGGLV